jgi:hypothetical protein
MPKPSQPLREAVAGRYEMQMTMSTGAMVRAIAMAAAMVSAAAAKDAGAAKVAVVVSVEGKVVA